MREGFPKDTSMPTTMPGTHRDALMASKGGGNGDRVGETGKESTWEIGSDTRRSMQEKDRK